MGQHHPLGFSGGAAGVNDGRQIFRLGCRGQCLRRRGLGQPGRQCRDGRPLRRRLGGKTRSGRMGRVGYHHLLQVRQWRADVADAFPLLRLGDDEQRNLCILQDVGDAARVVDGVQRHRHAAGGQHGLVNAHRVQPIRQQDGDTRPQGQVRRGQGTAPVGHPLSGLRPAQAGPLPGSGVEMPVGLGFGGLGGTPGQQFGQGVDGTQIGDGGSHADRRIRSAPGRVGPGDLQMIALRPFFTGAAAWRRGCSGLWLGCLGGARRPAEMAGKPTGYAAAACSPLRKCACMVCVAATASRARSAAMMAPCSASESSIRPCLNSELWRLSFMTLRRSVTI